MNVTIIGAGNMARGIGTRVLAGGHGLSLLTRDPSHAQELADELGATTTDTADGDVVVLAVPYTSLADVVASHDLAGKVVVDITNPVDFSTFTPIDLGTGSAAHEIASSAPGAKVVKAFNTTFAATLVDGEVGGQRLDVLIATDDDGARAAVTQLVEDGGLRAVQAGGLERAHELEALGYLHMALQEPLGTGFASAVKLLS